MNPAKDWASTIPPQFPGDEYHSDGSANAPWYDYLLFKSSPGFYIMVICDILVRFSNEVKRGIYDHNRWGYSSRYALSRMEAFGARFHISGMDNLRTGGGPYVFISNHMSSLETLIFPGIIVPHMPLSFVVKEQLLKALFFKHILGSTNPVSVGRKNPREDLITVLEEGQKKLKDGISVVVFPQSTRSPVFDPAAFNSLGVKLAVKAGVNIIPIAIKTDFWGDSKIIRGFGPIRRNREIHMEFGPALQPKGRGRETRDQVVKFIRKRLVSWGAPVAD